MRVLLFTYPDEFYYPFAFLVPDNMDVDLNEMAKNIEDTSERLSEVTDEQRARMLAEAYGLKPVEVFEATLDLMQEDRGTMVHRLTQKDPPEGT